MENPRFIAGELSTHFIDSEQTILEDMKRIIEREKQVQIPKYKVQIKSKCLNTKLFLTIIYHLGFCHLFGI